MPYFFRPEYVPATEIPVAGGFLRMLLSDRLVIITEQELQSLGPREREYFGYITAEAAIASTRRLLDSLMRENAAAQEAQTAEPDYFRQARQEYEAAQVAESVQRILGQSGSLAHQLRAAEERGEILNRRRREYRLSSHSNEGDIEPEDL